jgi:hypothetical protein
MKIRKTVMVPVRVELLCPNDGVVMVAVGQTQEKPPLYPHLCPKCGHAEKLKTQTPSIRFEPNGDPEESEVEII